MVLRSLRNFVFQFYGIDKVRGLALVQGPQQILGVINRPLRRGEPIIWNFKTGDSMRANIVKVLNDQYIVIEEKRLLSSKATLINIHEISFMMIAGDYIF